MFLILTWWLIKCSIKSIYTRYAAHAISRIWFQIKKGFAFLTLDKVSINTPNETSQALSSSCAGVVWRLPNATISGRSLMSVVSLVFTSTSLTASRFSDPGTRARSFNSAE